MNAPDTGADTGHPADAAEAHDPAGQERLRQLADEQAALRQVATLVADGARPAEVFGAVADELGRLIGAEATFVSRIDELSGERGEMPRRRLSPASMNYPGSAGRLRGMPPSSGLMAGSVIKRRSAS